MIENVCSSMLLRKEKRDGASRFSELGNAHQRKAAIEEGIHTHTESKPPGNQAFAGEGNLESRMGAAQGQV